MNLRLATNKQQAEPNTQVGLEPQQEQRPNGLEHIPAALNNMLLPPTATPPSGAHAKLVRQSPHASSDYSKQLFHQLQRTLGNRYVQRIVDLSRKGHEFAEVDQDIEQAIRSQRGAGRTMDTGLRHQMEAGFGSDFSGVRIHTGAEADGLNKNLHAKAFTTGRDIFFRDGEYRPGSRHGRELVAHELTHVVQQGGAKAQRQTKEAEDEPQAQIAGLDCGIQTKLTLGQPNDKYEQEADAVAQRIISQEHAGPKHNKVANYRKGAQTTEQQVTRQIGRQNLRQKESSCEQLQREEEEEAEELQLKPFVPLPIKGDDEEEVPLQAKFAGLFKRRNHGEPINSVSSTGEGMAQKSSTNTGLAPQGLLQLSPLSDELANVWYTAGKGMFFERLRNIGVSDPDVLDFITNNLSGDDLWLARNLFLHGREANWPIHLRVEREMKGWGDSGGKGVVFDILRTANGSEAGNAALTVSLARVFAAASDDIWLAQNLQTYGVEANWPIHLRVEREMKGWGDSGGTAVAFDILRTAAGAEAGNGALAASISRIFAAGSDDLWRAQNLQAYGPEITWPIPVLIPPASVAGEQVEFTGSHALAAYGGDPRINPRWTRGALDHASAYTKSASPPVNARFVVGNNLTRANIPAVTVRVKEGAMVLGTTAPLPPGATSIDVAGLGLTGLSDSANVHSSNYTLSWEASVDGGATWGPITTTGGHPVYWLHAAPLAAPLHNFAVAKATGYVAGAATVAASIRTGLRGEVDYDPGDPINPDPLTVYADGIGICTDFANLLTLLARSVGLTANSVMFWGGFESLGKNIWVSLGGVYGNINLVNVKSTNPAYNVPLAPISPLGWAFNYHAISRIGGILQDAALDISGIDAQAAHAGKVVRLLEPAPGPLPPGRVGVAYSEPVRRKDHTVGIAVRDYGARITGATFGDVYPLVFPPAAPSPYDVPVTWRITAGALPAGLALDWATGLIHGTPTAAGVFTVTIEDRAPGGTSHTFPLTITINP